VVVAESDALASSDTIGGGGLSGPCNSLLKAARSEYLENKRLIYDNIPGLLVIDSVQNDCEGVFGKALEYVNN